MNEPFLNIKNSAGSRSVQLVKFPVTIGRDSANSIMLADSSASRFHCRIERGAEGFIVSDTGSRNGTLLNGRKITQSNLQFGETIIIGQTHLILSTTPGEMSPDPDPVAANFRIADGDGDVLDDLEVIEDEDTLDDLEVVADTFDPSDNAGAEETLRRIADGMLDQQFSANDIALINTRGAAAHTAGEEVTASGGAINLVRLALLICFRSRATDIHLEPRADDFLLRIRVDGNLLELTTIEKPLGIKFVAVIKILCDLDTTQRSIVQEGHFSCRVPVMLTGPYDPKDRRVDYRLSFVPTLYGQKMVVRIFDAANAPLLMHELQLPPWMFKEVSHELDLSAGIILVCGPTGSGKTTTLYSFIRSCGTGNRNVVTIEDPIEVQIPETTQLPVDESAGKGFSDLLRSVLRQDPDVIMVGEIRDAETSRIALQAAVTGHLVLSTLHTRDTVGTIFRLMDLGVEPYMISQGLHIVVAQRLARKLCPFCKRSVDITPKQRAAMGNIAVGIRTVFEEVGCPRCLGTGYCGRRAFFELLRINDDIRQCIVKNPSPVDIYNLLRGTSFVGLLQAGFQLVVSGEASYDEIVRVTGI